MSAQLKPNQCGYDEEITRSIMEALDELPLSTGIKFEALYAIPAINSKILGIQHLHAVLKNLTHRAMIYKSEKYGYAVVRMGSVSAQQPAPVLVKTVEKPVAPTPERKAPQLLGSKSNSKPKKATTKKVRKDMPNDKPEQKKLSTDEDKVAIEAAAQALQDKIDAGEKPTQVIHYLESKLYALNRMANMTVEPMRSVLLEIADDLERVDRAS